MKKILKNKKGFTLVEIIVVLVILAILAGAGIPTMLGFIDDAKGKALVAEARAAYVASQSVASQDYGTGYLTSQQSLDSTELNNVRTLASLDSSDYVSAVVNSGKVTKVVYQKGSTGKVVTINAGGSVTVQ